MIRRAGLLLLVLWLGTVAGCTQRPGLLIGYLSGQPDSTLMAELVAETLRQSGARALTVGCPDLVNCGRRLQAGDIDMLPDYSGSARVFFSTSAVGDGSLDVVRQTLTPAGMTVTPGLGFRAPYVLLMEAEKALEKDVSAIEDLSRLENARFSVPAGYMRQPGDGLLALARRYGLDIRTDAVTEATSPSDRMAALLSGGTDVAVMRLPYVRSDMGLTVLADGLGFYPRYEATVVLGPRASPHRGFVESALEPLYGSLNPEEVERALHEIVIEGYDVETAARRLLVAEGILAADSPTMRRPEMVVAHTGVESLNPLSGQANLVLRRAYPERPVRMLSVASPLEALEQGWADLALVHTSDFFQLTPEGLFLGRVQHGEAIAAIGRRHFLLLLGGQASASDDPLAGRLGTPPGWTAGGKVAARMLVLAGYLPDVRSNGPDLVRALRNRELDAAIVLLNTDTREALQALPRDAPMLRAASLTEVLARAPFFVNESRLASSPVPGEDEPVDTYSMQVLLAGPAPQGRMGPVHGGPASAIATRNLPVPLREAEAIAAAVESPELPDPVLPSFRNRQAADHARLTESSWLETLLIVAGIAFMAWAGWLVAQPSAPRP
ncbi:MAG: glycine betaine ABC transporter substrate-binding protein [Gammaproteobacteria bacterium]|nr:glycine betaine ABC transporter substrate-binding protein [Gammaproteobacteria bacterium]